MLLRAAERFGVDPCVWLVGLSREERALVLGFERLRQAEEVRDERLRMQAAAGDGATQ